MKGKHVRSTDPRKPAIVAAMKRSTGATKITLVREVTPGVFEGNCLKSARAIGTGAAMFVTICRLTLTERDMTEEERAAVFAEGGAS